MPLYQTAPRILLEPTSLIVPPRLATVAFASTLVFLSSWLLESFLYRHWLGLEWKDAFSTSLRSYQPFALLVSCCILFVPGMMFVPMIAWWLVVDGGWWLFSLTLLAALYLKAVFVARKLPELGARLNASRYRRVTKLAYAFALMAIILACTPARRLSEPYDERWGTGDEPRYVRIAASLLHDGDTDIGNAAERIGVRVEVTHSLAGFLHWIPAGLANGWEATRVLLGAEPPPAPRHLGGPVIAGSHGGTFYLYQPGFPLLLVPSMAIDSLVDPTRLTVTLVTSMLLGVVCTLLLARLVESLVGSCAAGYGLSLLMGVTLPLFFFHFQLYSEVTAAICVSILFLVLLAPRIDLAGGVAFGLTCGFLPWLHTKFVPIWGVCLLAFGYRAFRERLARQTWVTGTSLACLGMGLQCLYVFHITGSIMPDALWVAGGYPRDANIVNRETLSGLYYLLLGRSEGLLVYAPLYVFVLPGLLALSRKSKFAFVLTLAVVVPYLLAAASHDRGGAGAWSPPSRYIVPLLPAFALCLAAWLDREGHRTLHWAACVIAAAGSFWTARAMLTGRAFPYDRALFLASRLVDPSPVLGSEGEPLARRLVYPLFLALALCVLFVWKRRAWSFTPGVLLLATLALILTLGASSNAWSPDENWVHPRRLRGVHRVTGGQPLYLQLPDCGSRAPRLRLEATAASHRLGLIGYGLKRELRVASGPASEIDVSVEPFRRYGGDPSQNSTLYVLWLQIDEAERPVDVEALCR